MKKNRYCPKCGHKMSDYLSNIIGCIPCNIFYEFWAREHWCFFEERLMFPPPPARSPCDNGSCDNSNNGCVIMGHCDESGEGKRWDRMRIHPDEMQWDLNRKTFYEDDVYPGGDYV